jgi:CPA2 family monovalent cation:H+ antiporter-2
LEHPVSFLYDLALVMLAAGLVTVICNRLRQPVVIGYILAGLLIGPHLSPVPLIHDEEAIRTLSELGVIFLLFTLGLEFRLGRLKEVGGAALLATVLEIPVLLGAGYAAGRWFGWNPMDSLFLGAILAISSTTITVKSLADLGQSKEKYAQVIYGILIVEDIFAIVLIALLSGIARTGTLEWSKALADIGQLAAFLAVSLTLGFLAIPRLIHWIARSRNEEVLLISSLALCFGFSMFTVRLGYSVALGAFLIGAIIAEAREIHKITALMGPVKDMFSAVFFVSVGMLIQPKLIMENLLPVAAITVIVVLGKVATCFTGSFLAGHDVRTSTRIGMGKAQIGEFSFIIASLGLALGVTSSFLYPIAVSVSVVTTLLTPYLIRYSEGMVARFERWSPGLLLSYYNLYTRWIRRVQESTGNTQVKNILRRIAGQLVLFFLLIAGSLLGAVALSRLIPLVFPAIGEYMDVIRSFLWLLALVLVGPVIVAAFRKMKALGMILADLGIPESMARGNTQEVRTVVSAAFLVLGSLTLGGWIVLLSSTILPSRGSLLLLTPLLLFLAYLLRENFNKIYVQSKGALLATFDNRSLEIESGAPEKTPGPAGETRLDTFEVRADLPWAGRLIGETELRTRTGASIAAIGRDGGRIANPGADEEILAGDRLMILGDRAQIAKAFELLRAGPKGSEKQPSEGESAAA